jgi:hypothetical protein
MIKAVGAALLWWASNMTALAAPVGLPSGRPVGLPSGRSTLPDSGPTLPAGKPPAAGSAAVIDIDHGFYRSRLGFTISRGQTNWIQTAPPTASISVATMYRAPQSNRGVQPALTVRTDRLPQVLPLQSYAREWLRDYHRLGFEVLNSKSIEIEGQQAFLLDIFHKESQRQLRQVVFLRERTAVVMTCRDHPRTFARTVKDCNAIIRTFHWNR